LLDNMGRYIASAQSITHSAEDLDTCVAQQSLTASRVILEQLV